MKNKTLLTWALAAFLTCMAIAIILGPPQANPKAYYLEIRGSSILVVDDLSNVYSKVGIISEWEDPDSFREVLETQPGWETGFEASEAYFYLLED